MKNNLYIINNKLYKSIKINDLIKGKIAEGIFSFVKKINTNSYILARDKYGVKKLFYTFKNHKIVYADNFIDLKKRTNSSKIFSLSPGYYMIYDKVKKTKTFKKIKFNKKIPNLSALNIVRAINNFFLLLKKNNNNSCIVLLSGGLDSTIIAYLAKKVFKNTIAITCVFLSKKDFEDYKRTKKIDSKKFHDFNNAKKISNKIGLKFVPLVLPIEVVKNDLIKTMYCIQDWRDFNVHCGSLNYQIAKYIKPNYSKKIPIFTGDFMNELFADYTSEFVDGKEYYKQLEVSKFLKSKWLTEGLETSDRENGIFNKFNLKIIQPYFLVIDMFKGINKNFLKKNSKHNFNKNIIPKSLFKIMYKKKIRAQITDREGGILNYFIQENFSQKRILRIFCKNFNFSENWTRKFITFGKYKIERN